MIKEKEEKYLYKNLFGVIKIKDCNVKRILELIEERAKYYPVWSLRLLLFDSEITQDFAFLKKEKISSYRNILEVLSNKNDPCYDKYYEEKFKEYFE